MKRRELILGGAAGTVLWLKPVFAGDEGGEAPVPPKVPRKAKKKTPPTFVPEVPKIIRACGREIPVLCSSLQRDMNSLNKAYRAMIKDIERKIKKGGLNKTEEKNLTGMLKYMRRKNNELVETATGRSESYISERNRKVGDSFCDKAAKAMAAAAANSADYQKKGRSNRDRVNDIKAARKNLRTANRVINKACEVFIKKARSHEATLAKTSKAAGTSGIYSAARKAAIEKAVRKVMNCSGRAFKILDKEQELQQISFNIYGKA
jgi:hypothetical protein